MSHHFNIYLYLFFPKPPKILPANIQKTPKILHKNKNSYHTKAQFPEFVNLNPDLFNKYRKPILRFF